MNSLQHRENDRQKKKTGRWQYGRDKNPIRVQMEFQVQLISVSRSARLMFDDNR